MNCPVCKKHLVILEHDRIEVDHCLECGGVWLDAGELELILDNPIKTEELLATFVSHRHAAVSARKCPICKTKMHEVQVAAAEETLVLDQCPKQHGFWFDRDELQKTISAAGTAMDAKVKDLLTAMFGSKG